MRWAAAPPLVLLLAAQVAFAEGVAVESDADRAACIARGGTVEEAGHGSNSPVCVTWHEDVGKSCITSADCEGLCLWPELVCSARSPLYGCYEFIDEQGAWVGLCIN